MNIAFQLFGQKCNEWENESFKKGIIGLLNKEDLLKYKIVESSKKAEIIILLESNRFKERHYLDEILNNPLIKDRAEDCYTINYEDDALGLIQGVYAGLPRKRYNTSRHLPWCYIKPPNQNDRDRREFFKANKIDPTITMSFRGALSHPVREKLFRQKHHLQTLGPITRIDRWFNHTQQEKEDYWREIMLSKFVLCPRGIAPVSIRLFEVMEMGRVPIIIADEWVEPQNIEWDSFSIRVPENKIRNLPDIISSKTNDWEQMASKARTCWETNFSPQNCLGRALDQITTRHINRRSDSNEITHLRAYQSFGKKWSLGWTTPQRIQTKLKQVIKLTRMST